MRTDVRREVESVQQGPEIWIRGPVAPPGRRFAWVGTHGGAGVSTLAAVYGGHDSGRDWPGPGAPTSVLLVARTHAAGLLAALRGLELFRRGEHPPGLDLDAVVLVADAPGGSRARSPSGSRRSSPRWTCTACPGSPRGASVT